MPGPPTAAGCANIALSWTGAAVSIRLLAEFIPTVSEPAAVDASAAGICAGSVIPTAMLVALIACPATFGTNNATPGLPFRS